jgi:ABC-type lipoprotein export system ATPase subunit/predicted metal-dependent phosphoesterase TrpH
MNSAGSVWQKWDLHVHTPASFHWNGKRLTELTADERDELCKDILDRMNEADVCAFCIMDYWTFDGYLALRDYLQRHPQVSSKRIFPGIELRMAAPTNFRLNTHVLFSDEVTSDSLGHFLSHLKLAAYDGKPPTRQHFIELARSYDAGKLKLFGCTLADKADDEKMLSIGLQSALVTRESVMDAIEVVGKEHCLVVQPYDTSDGLEDLDWKRHPYTDSYLMKWADCFETRDPVHVNLFLGLGHPTKPTLGSEFIDNLGGYPKPVFSGSDAHRVADYGVYPSGRATWLKAQPTFKGLRQVCHEPSLRCHIGDRPPKLDHVEQNPTKYINSVKLAKIDGSTLVEHWFDGREIELNPGLIAIIGNKGGGKSALADILALGGNSHCTRMEFLNDSRFRGSGNKAQHFVATLTWTDGTSVEVNLGNNADLREPERVRYLPQHFIEDLCNEIATGNETNFGKELRKVIFSHVPVEQQLGMGTLDELLEYLIEARRQAFAQVQQSLRALNETILRNEQELSEDTLKSYRTALALKQSELEAIDKVPLAVVEKPPEEPGDEATKEAVRKINEAKQQFELLQTELDTAKNARVELVAERTSLSRLLGHIDNFQALHTTFVEEHGEEFTNAGFNIADIVTVTINRQPVTDQLAAVNARLSELELLVDGREATETEPEVKGLEATATTLSATIAKLQEGLNAPEKAYQAYLKEVDARNARRNAIIGATDKPDTIEYFKERIKRATEFIPAELDKLRDERRELVRKLHAELLAIRGTFETLYAPVQQIASDAANSAHALQLEFDASLVPMGFEENFLDFIHRGRKGNFYGEMESRSAVGNLLRSHNFDDTESVVAFTDSIMNALTVVERDGDRETMTVASQLREKKKISDLYDYVFGLDYLEIRYNLRLGGKDISQLSPGEKGALLLVFYLLLDTEEIPIIIDQPEHNLDNESVVRLLVDCIRQARSRRQVMIVTHNPNLAVYCDADQIICCSIDKMDGNRIGYSTGAIEDYDINAFAVNVLEGTYPAFDNRRKKWHKPLPFVPGNAAVASHNSFDNEQQLSPCDV